MKVSKVMTAKESIAKFIEDGSNLMVGGFFHSISHVLTHEIIRQKKKGLTVCAASSNEHVDQLIGAGCVDRIESSYNGLEVFGPSYCYRRAIESSIPHKVEIEDYTNFAMMARFMAGSLGIPYVPINSMKGSDLLKYTAWKGENKARLMKDPFGSGFEHVLVPALQPEVGYFHVQRADAEGNCQMWGISGDAPWSVRSCKKVIVSCEEIVSREIIGRDPNRTILPGYKVVAVVEAPFGAHPKNCQGYYDVDRPFMRDYIKRSKTAEGWQAFMDEWVYSVSNRDEYIQKYINAFGIKRFLDLKAHDFSSSSVNYGF
jgi:glutaconate CoA-transferase subunit A